MKNTPNEISEQIKNWGLTSEEEKNLNNEIEDYFTRRKKRLKNYKVKKQNINLSKLL